MDADTTLKASFETRGWTPPTDLGTCVTGLVNAVARGMARIVAAHGLTHIDFALLRLFLGAEEWTATQLAEMLPLAPSGISRSVSKLVDKGPDPEATPPQRRRVVILTLTDEGLALTQELHVARPGIRLHALRGRQRRGDGGLRLRLLKSAGQLLSAWSSREER